MSNDIQHDASSPSRVSTAGDPELLPEQYRVALQHAPVGMCLVSLDGKFLSVNHAFCQMLGHEEADLTGRKIVDVTHPDDVDLTESWLDELVAGPDGRAQFEKRYRHRQGHVVWGTVSVQLVRSTDEKPRFFVSHVQDITERKRAESALRESEERFRIAFDNAPTGMSIIAPNGGYLAVNPRLCRMFGYSPEELLSGTLQVVTHPDDVERSNAWIRKKLCGEPCEEDFEKRFIHKDGHVVWGQVRAQWIREQTGALRMAVAHILDISERKRAEAERAQLETQLHRAQKMEAIGHLAGGIAHDFNNLLTAIGGNASLALTDTDPNAPTYTLLTEITKAVDSAANLTRQLLTFSRQQLISPKVLNLNGTVTHLGKMLRRLLGEDLELATGLAPDLGNVRIDAGQAEQILINLAINARDAMPDGGRLMIETGNIELDEDYCREHGQAIPGQYVMLAVSDSGTGMTQETKARIFEPFFTTKEQGKGTGLGLAMVYGAVRQNDGLIEVYSELGQGTTFKIYLPCVDAPVEETRPRIAVSLSAGRETIVLVEDDPMVRALAQTVLVRQGYRVHAFPSGDAAVAELPHLADGFALIITDVVMPGINGRVFAERARAIRPNAKVIFTSGYTQNVIAHHGILDEGIEFLPKPYTVDMLVRRVREVLDQK